MGRFITHRFGMSDFTVGYDVFGNAATTHAHALQVVLPSTTEESS